MDLPSLTPPLAVPPTTTSATIADPTPHALNLNHNHNHPPYPEMICAAITALRERDGSSKRAIAKYIEGAYTNLPQTHSAMLTHHLNRLKNAGNLVLVKKSYKLFHRSDSDPPPAPAPAPALPTNDVVMNNNSITTATPATLPSSRGRGRPRKAPGIVVAAVDKPKRGRGRPKKTEGPVQQRVPIKKKPGRPRKLKTVKGRQVLQQQAQAQAQALSLSQSQDQLSNVTVSYVTSGANANVPVQLPVPDGARRRGRPRKFGTVVDVDSGGPRRGPGRPKKIKNLSSALTQAAEAQAQSNADIKRKLEFFQAKVKQIVTVLKSQITSGSQISTVAAIQELEGLASMDINIPLKEDTQPPVLHS